MEITTVIFITFTFAGIFAICKYLYNTNNTQNTTYAETIIPFQDDDKL